MLCSMRSIYVTNIVIYENNNVTFLCAVWKIAPMVVQIYEKILNIVLSLMKLYTMHYSPSTVCEIIN